MAKWFGLKNPFNKIDSAERDLRKRFPDPDALKQAREEIKRCEDTVKKADADLKEKMTANPDKSEKDFTPPGMTVAEKWRIARDEANRSHRSEVDRAVADRDKGLQRIEDTQNGKNLPKNEVDDKVAKIERSLPEVALDLMLTTPEAVTPDPAGEADPWTPKFNAEAPAAPELTYEERVARAEQTRADRAARDAAYTNENDLGRSHTE